MSIDRAALARVGPARARGRVACAALAWVVLSAWLAACTTGEFYRECDSNADCPTELVCSFSSCITPSAAGLVDEDAGQDSSGGDADAAPAPDADASPSPDVDVSPDADASSSSDTDAADDADSALPDVDEDADDADAPCMPEAEVCDGADNDCDGQIDEDNDDLLSQCAPGAGAVVAGCDAGACAYACEGALADANGDLDRGAQGDGCECTPSGAEVCDGADNDCDGQIDEDNDDLLSQCAPMFNAAADACAAGACVYVCAPTGDVDVCDGYDNDCDGATDEDPALCALQAGVCAGATEPCAEGTPQACAASVYQAHSPRFQDGVETFCDGQDNNCDGATDELCCTVPGAFDPLVGRGAGYRWSDVDFLYIPERDIYVFAGSRDDASDLDDPVEVVAGRLDARGRLIGELVVVSDGSGRVDGAVELVLLGDQVAVVWGENEPSLIRLRLMSAQTGALGPVRGADLAQGRQLVANSAEFIARAFNEESVLVANVQADPVEQRLFIELYRINALTGAVEDARAVDTNNLPGAAQIAFPFDLLVRDDPNNPGNPRVWLAFSILYYGAFVEGEFEESDMVSVVREFSATLDPVRSWSYSQDLNTIAGDDDDIDFGFRLVPDGDGLLAFYNARDTPAGLPKLTMQRLSGTLAPIGAPVVVRVLDRRSSFLFDAQRLPDGALALGYVWAVEPGYEPGVNTRAFIDIYDPVAESSRHVRVLSDVDFQLVLLQNIAHPQGLLNVTVDDNQLVDGDPRIEAVLLNAELDELCLPE